MKEERIIPKFPEFSLITISTIFPFILTKYFHLLKLDEPVRKYSARAPLYGKRQPTSIHFVKITRYA